MTTRAPPNRQGSRTAVMALIRRDLAALHLQPLGLITPAAFLICAALILALITPASRTGQAVDNTAALVILAALAALMALENLLHDDVRDQSLATLVLAGLPIGLYVAGRWMAFLIITGGPLLLACLLLAPLLGTPPRELPFFLCVLALTLAGMGSVGMCTAAMTIGAARNPGLAALITLPLCLPILLFAAACLDSTGVLALRSLLLLAGSCLIAVALLPLTAHLLRLSLDDQL